MVERAIRCDDVFFPVILSYPCPQPVGVNSATLRVHVGVTTVVLVIMSPCHQLVGLNSTTVVWANGHDDGYSGKHTRLTQG